MEAVENFINSGAEPAERMIRDLVECELAYINTDHAQFIGGSRAIGMVMERRSRLPEETAIEEGASKNGQTAVADINGSRHHPRAPGKFLPIYVLRYGLPLGLLAILDYELAFRGE